MVEKKHPPKGKRSRLDLWREMKIAKGIDPFCDEKGNPRDQVKEQVEEREEKGTHTKIEILLKNGTTKTVEVSVGEANKAIDEFKQHAGGIIEINMPGLNKAVFDRSEIKAIKTIK